MTAVFQEKRYGLVWTGSYANGTAHSDNFASGILGRVAWGAVINLNSRNGGGFMAREELNPLNRDLPRWGIFGMIPILVILASRQFGFRRLFLKKS